MSYELLREQCEAYLLGGLEGEELQHLQSRIDNNDPECLEALREATELVAQLGHAAPLAEPPALLRSRILNAARAEKRTSALPVSNWAAYTGWAVAAALLIATLVNRNGLTAIRQELAEARGEVSRLTLKSDQYRKVASILMARDAQVIRLTATAPEAPQFRAYWSKESGLVLAGSNVSAPASGRTMQLWVVPKTGKPVSAGLFAPDSTGQVILIAENVFANPGDAAALAISDEPMGGSPQPTTTPAWVGKLGD